MRKFWEVGSCGGLEGRSAGDAADVLEGNKDTGGTKDAAGGGGRQGRCAEWGTRALSTQVTGSRDGNVECTERSGKAGGQPGRLWGPDRRAATLGAGGNGACVPRHGRSVAGARERCRPPRHA